ncbi:MAG: DUF1194 domain-containing protein [Alphaproteobacteria bacterium]
MASRLRFALRILIYCFLLGCVVAKPAVADGAADLELVLAIDASSSVSYDEFQLQMFGLAAAFRDPAVINAIRSAAPGGVAVSLVQWASAHQQAIAVNWTLVRDAASAALLADRIDAAPRLVIGGATAIGSVVSFAIDLLNDNRFVGKRRAIDVSGDGKANQGPSPAAARRRALTAGITINALAILNEEPALDAYYDAIVVGGAGSFTLVADDYEDFARAIRLKLILEITGASIARRDLGHG